MWTKKKTFETYILPCPIYGAETTWRKDLLRKMDVFQNNMRICTIERKIDRIPINTLLIMTRLRPVSTLVKRKKLTWFGHIKRSDLPVRAVCEGMVSGKRRRGRPIGRCRNDIYEWTGRAIAELNHMVKNRNEWRSFVDSIYLLIYRC